MLTKFTLFALVGAAHVANAARLSATPVDNMPVPDEFDFVEIEIAGDDGKTYCEAHPNDRWCKKWKRQGLTGKQPKFQKNKRYFDEDA